MWSFKHVKQPKAFGTSSNPFFPSFCVAMQYVVLHSDKGLIE